MMFVNTIGENKMISEKISNIFSLHKNIIHSQDYYIGGSLTNFFKLQKSAGRNIKQDIKKSRFLLASKSFLTTSKRKRQVPSFLFSFFENSLPLNEAKILKIKAAQYVIQLL